jgi:putative glutathione S-transferase
MTETNYKITHNKDGSFNRQVSSFRNWISKDEASIFKPEKDRYHLYVSLACPWAHRTLIVRVLKGLEHVISVSVVATFLGVKGWYFDPAIQGELPTGMSAKDDVNGCEYLSQIYLLAEPNYTARWSVPVLWDKKTKTIVNNESSEIIRIFNSAFNEFSTNPDLDLYPTELKGKIDELNEWIYPTINNGVYRAGFAGKKEPYEEAFDQIFAALDMVEEILSKQRYLTGSKIMEADIRLITTLLRFDPVYYGHFKCNRQHVYEFPNIWAYVREFYHLKAVKDTTHFGHIKAHYYSSHLTINGTGIVPKGPILNYTYNGERDSK